MVIKLGGKLDAFNGGRVISYILDLISCVKKYA